MPVSGPGPGLVLGTVQFGLAYGVAGRGEAVPEPEARAILERASAAGIGVLDTAPAYGDIEGRLEELADGLDFTIVSKIARLPSRAGGSDAVDAVRQSVEQSIKRLGARLTTLLFHHADDLMTPTGEAAWRAAAEAAGPAVRLGVSCYGPEELIELLTRFPIAAAQLPGNAFDQRLAAAGVVERLHGVEVYLRSVFLQGLLLMPVDAAARQVPAAQDALVRWRHWCDARQLPPVIAALGIARGLPGIGHCVIGVDRVAQLDEVVRAWAEAAPAAAPALAVRDADVIDPRCWTMARS